MRTLKEIVRQLSNVAGPPGFEERVSELLTSELRKFGGCVSTDFMGNVVYRPQSNKPGAPKLMLAAHMDEIGLMVEHIEDNGLIRFVKLGMIDDGLLQGRRVVVLGKHDIFGVIGSVPPHIRQQTNNVDKFIDAGFSSKEEVLEAGIDVGTPAVFDCSFCELPGAEGATGKALDDRVGCAVLLEVIRKIHLTPTNLDIYAAFLAQEEVGWRGSRAVAERIKPDLAVVVDMVPVYPGSGTRVELGRGPVVRLLEQEGWNGVIASKQVVTVLQRASDSLNIKLQRLVRPTGMTDAGSIQRAACGIPVCSLEVPVRYAHSPVEVVKWDDIVKTIDVVEHVCVRGF